jgi:hypothetical protein
VTAAEEGGETEISDRPDHRWHLVTASPYLGLIDIGNAAFEIVNHRGVEHGLFRSALLCPEFEGDEPMARIIAARPRTTQPKPIVIIRPPLSGS